MIMRINKPKRKSEHKNYRADQLKKIFVFILGFTAVTNARCIEG